MNPNEVKNSFTEEEEGGFFSECFRVSRLLSINTWNSVADLSAGSACRDPLILETIEGLDYQNRTAFGLYHNFG